MKLTAPSVFAGRGPARRDRSRPSDVGTKLSERGIEASIQFLNSLFASTPLSRVGFRLWEGTAWPDHRQREAVIALKHPGALRAMFASGTDRGMAEAYMRGDFDIEGDVEAALELADALGRRPAGDLRGTALNYYLLHRLPVTPAADGGWHPFEETDEPRHTRERDRKAVSFHYDVSNAFYRLWLDRRMLYSCAYFEQEQDDLETAQFAKLHHLCRKLRLKPGQRLLDIGCGWGGLSLFAAQEYGAQVTGITLSERQAEHAAALVEAAGLQTRVSIALRDYRDMNEAEGFDAIVSVGMSEHVGRDQMPAYFQAAGRLLKQGGVFMNHAIGAGVRPFRRRGPSFIDAHVFPDSDVPPIPLVLQAAESAGLEVRDVENLREHYARTLRHWVKRLEANHDAARAHVSESAYRVWRLYLAGSARGFDCGQLAIYQTLLSKPDAKGHSDLPLTRRDWYAAAPAGETAATERAA